MLYSPGGEVFSARHHTQPAADCTASATSCPVHRCAPITSAEPGESQPGGGRAADLGDGSNRGPVCVHPRAEKQQRSSSSSSNLVLMVRALCSSARRLLAFNSRTQPTVEYHLLALQAPSSRYSCMRRWGRKVCQSACSQWACMCALLQTGSYRSAWRCQFKGLMKNCPEGKVMT